jgi:hypothetical protein
MEFIISVTNLINGRQDTFRNLYQARKFVKVAKYNYKTYLDTKANFKIEKIYITKY